MISPPKILVDSSIWIDHINKSDEELAGLMRRRRVLLHPMVVAEIALGSLTDRQILSSQLAILPATSVVPHAEIMATIEWRKLYGCGIGYVDLHLLAAAQSVGALLWTRDKKLLKQATRLGVAFTPA